MIRLIKPYITFEEVEREFRDIFDGGIFTKGKYVELFREELKKYTGAKHAFLTTSATTALTMGMKLLKIGPGDEVIVSDFSFPATANIVEDVGAVPVFVDVNLDTFNMCPEELKRKITDKTKAVIFVDALGNPSGIHEIKAICQKHGIPLIEDAACAIGSSENEIKCGNISDITCFSFHPRKLLTTGEGGAITTNNDNYAKKLEVKLNHGATVIDGKFNFVDYGYNYRMNEIQAAMGIIQLRKLDDIVISRNELREQFIKRLMGVGYVPQKVNHSVCYNVQSLVFVVPEQISRDSLISYLKNNNIESTIGTYCLSGCSYYRDKYNNVQNGADWLQSNTITLPCYEGVMTEVICNKIISYK